MLLANGLGEATLMPAESAKVILWWNSKNIAHGAVEHAILPRKITCRYGANAA